METEKDLESIPNTDIDFHVSKLHIYTDTKELHYQVTKELKSDRSTRMSNDGCPIECGTIQTEHSTLSVGVVAIENVHQFVSHETERDCSENAMVFLTMGAQKRVLETEWKALILCGTAKKTVAYSSLRDLWEKLANIMSHEEVAPRVYPMKSSPVGICMIINNKTFLGEICDRVGTDVDAKSLCSLFKKINFDVQPFHDLTDTHIIQEVKQISLKNHTAYDIFVCCILSHGLHGSVLGVNNEAVPISEITSQFRINVCPSLAGKPKLFFIQACQGQHGQEVPYSVDALSDTEPTGIPLACAADGADFLVACSSEPGYASFRHEETGSFYINSLVKQLQASPGKYLSAILTEVCRNICKKTVEGNYKQVPYWTSTLTKEVVLHPSQAILALTYK